MRKRYDLGSCHDDDHVRRSATSLWLRLIDSPEILLDSGNILQLLDSVLLSIFRVDIHWSLYLAF